MAYRLGPRVSVREFVKKEIQGHLMLRRELGNHVDFIMYGILLDVHLLLKLLFIRSKLGQHINRLAIISIAVVSVSLAMMNFLHVVDFFADILLFYK